MLIAFLKVQKFQIPISLILKECAIFATVKICSKMKPLSLRIKILTHIESDILLGSCGN